MTGNYKEKYLRINLDYAPMAGRVDQVMTTQKRLVEKLVKRRDLPEDVKALLLTVAESIEATDDLMDFTKKFFHGVVDDANALLEGADLRNKIKWQSQLLEENGICR